jgi:hypothetical protein
MSEGEKTPDQNSRRYLEPRMTALTRASSNLTDQPSGETVASRQLCEYESKGVSTVRSNYQETDDGDTADQEDLVFASSGLLSV